MKVPTSILKENKSRATAAIEWTESWVEKTQTQLFYQCEQS